MRARHRCPPPGRRPRWRPAEVQQRVLAGATALDVRSAAAFGAAHVPGSLNVGLSGQFASWAGTLAPPDRPILLVADGEDEVREAALRLARVGLERIEGYLAGGIAAWEQAGLALEAVEQVTVTDLFGRLAADPALQVLDVRRPSEYETGHLPRAVNVPLDRLTEDPVPLDPARPAAIVCAGGYRSSSAAGILERRGFRDLLNVVGGTTAWVKAGYQTE